MDATEVSIAGEVGSWPGVELQAGRLGEADVWVGSSHLGNMTDETVEIGFHSDFAAQLVAVGRARPGPEDESEGGGGDRDGSETALRRRAAVHIVRAHRSRAGGRKGDPELAPRPGLRPAHISPNPAGAAARAGQ